MTVTFADLVHIYCQSEFNLNSDEVTFDLKSAEDLMLLQLLSSDDYYDDTAVEIVTDNPQIGQIITLNLGQPNFKKFGRLFNTVDDFVRGDMGQFYNTQISQSPYFIKSEKYASFDENVPAIIRNYQSVKTFVYALDKMASYSDRGDYKLCFFSAKTFELSINIGQQLYQFTLLLKTLDDKHIQVIQDFCNWLHSDEKNHHINEKKSILAFVFADALPSGATLIDVLKNIQHISESVQNQYALYLENFSYGKFVKKLEENSEKFITKTNETISKVLPQFLGLPFLTAIPAALKSGDNGLVYLALIAYCVMCFLALDYQKVVLNNLQGDVEHFETDGKVPEKLLEQWEKDKTKIKYLIRKQTHLYYFLLIAVILCASYGVLKLVLNWNFVQIICNL
jgi:hypothetical protein